MAARSYATRFACSRAKRQWIGARCRSYGGTAGAMVRSSHSWLAPLTCEGRVARKRRAPPGCRSCCGAVRLWQTGFSTRKRLYPRPRSNCSRSTTVSSLTRRSRQRKHSAGARNEPGNDTVRSELLLRTFHWWGRRLPRRLPRRKTGRPSCRRTAQPCPQAIYPRKWPPHLEEWSAQALISRQKSRTKSIPTNPNSKKPRRRSPLPVRPRRAAQSHRAPRARRDAGVGVDAADEEEDGPKHRLPPRRGMWLNRHSLHRQRRPTAKTLLHPRSAAAMKSKRYDAP